MRNYVNITPNQIYAEKQHIVSVIFKLLPYKQENYKFIDNYFESVLQVLYGFNKISGFQPEMLTIISLIEYARYENDFKKYVDNENLKSSSNKINNSSQ